LATCPDLCHAVVHGHFAPNLWSAVQGTGTKCRRRGTYFVHTHIALCQGLSAVTLEKRLWVSSWVKRSSKLQLDPGGSPHAWAHDLIITTLGGLYGGVLYLSHSTNVLCSHTCQSSSPGSPHEGGPCGTCATLLRKFGKNTVSLSPLRQFPKLRMAAYVAAAPWAVAGVSLRRRSLFTHELDTTTGAPITRARVVGRSLAPIPIF